MPVPLTPLIGDTLFENDRDHFKLFPEVDGFQWAVFSVDTETVVTAKICVLRDGEREFTFIRMGSLPSIRKGFTDKLKEEGAAKRQPGSFYIAVSLARLPENTATVNSRRAISLRLELGYRITPWLAIGGALDGFDQNQGGVFSFLILLSPPAKFWGLEPYAYYNPRPFAGILRQADDYDQSIGVGVALPLGRSGIRIRGGAVLLITSWNEYRPIYSPPPEYYFIQYEKEAMHRTVGIAELSFLIPL